MGGVTGLAVRQGRQRLGATTVPNDLTNIELDAELDPPMADCCTLPPAMIHFDKAGNVIGSFDAPQGHGMDVDSRGSSISGRTPSASTTRRPASWSAAIAHTPETEGGGRSSRSEPPNQVRRARAARDRLPASSAASGRGAAAAAAARQRRPGAQARGSNRGLQREVSADHADDRRRHRRDPHRRCGQ